MMAGERTYQACTQLRGQQIPRLAVEKLQVVHCCRMLGDSTVVDQSAGNYQQGCGSLFPSKHFARLAAEGAPTVERAAVGGAELQRAPAAVTNGSTCTCSLLLFSC